jgi:hypothetical protein
MQTVLDDAETWFLQGIVYQDDLRIIVAEGFKSDDPEDLVIAGTNLGPAYSVDVSSESRRFVVRFPRNVAWQVIVESFTSRDDYESGDDGFLQTLDRSRYLDHVHEHHGWFRETVGPANHYRLCMVDEVIDVIAFDAPMIEEWKDK